MNINRPDIINDYLRHKDINNYLDYIAFRYSKFVTVYTIGKTFEGRALKAIKIDWYKVSKRPKTSVGGSSSLKEKQFLIENQQEQHVKNPNNDNLILNENRNWICIEAGTHAREWITVTVALYCIYQLTEKHCHNLDLLKTTKFLIIPLVNADGYEYTHDKNRQWRKNRRPIPRCKSIGTDCNRNYDFHWENGSNKHYKNTYRGEMPFSESETCAVRNVLQRLGDNLIFFLSLHSYAQSIMYPWGYTKDLPFRWKQLHYLAQYGRNAIHKATGRKYRCGSISKLTKRTYSGSIVDYAFGVQKVPFALVMELPSSKIGFQPARELIRPIGDESWIGIKAMSQRAFEIINPKCCKVHDSKDSGICN